MLLCLKTFFRLDKYGWTSSSKGGQFVDVTDYGLIATTWTTLTAEHVFSFRKAGKCLIFYYCLFSWVVDFILALLSTKYQCHGWKIGLISSRLLLLPFVPHLLGKKMMFPTTNFSTRVQVIPDALFRDSWPLELYKIGLWGFKASCFHHVYGGFDTYSIHFCCPRLINLDKCWKSYVSKPIGGIFVQTSIELLNKQ